MVNCRFSYSEKNLIFKKWDNGIFKTLDPNPKLANPRPKKKFLRPNPESRIQIFWHFGYISSGFCYHAAQKAYNLLNRVDTLFLFFLFYPFFPFFIFFFFFGPKFEIFFLFFLFSKSKILCENFLFFPFFLFYLFSKIRKFCHFFPFRSNFWYNMLYRSLCFWFRGRKIWKLIISEGASQNFSSKFELWQLGFLVILDHGGTSEGQSHCMNYWRNVHEFDVHDSEMDTVLKIFLWKKNLTAPNPKIFYVYGGEILVFKGNFFQHLNQNICPPVFLSSQAWIRPKLERLFHNS